MYNFTILAIFLLQFSTEEEDRRKCKPCTKEGKKRCIIFIIRFKVLFWSGSKENHVWSFSIYPPRLQWGNTCLLTIWLKLLMRNTALWAVFGLIYQFPLFNHHILELLSYAPCSHTNKAELNALLNYIQASLLKACFPSFSQWLWRWGSSCQEACNSQGSARLSTEACQGEQLFFLGLKFRWRWQETCRQACSCLKTTS